MCSVEERLLHEGTCSSQTQDGKNNVSKIYQFDVQAPRTPVISFSTTIRNNVSGELSFSTIIAPESSLLLVYAPQDVESSKSSRFR